MEEKKRNFWSDLFFYTFISLYLIAIVSYEYKLSRENRLIDNIRTEIDYLKNDVDLAKIQIGEISINDTIVMPKGGSLDRTLCIKKRKEQTEFADIYGYKTKFNKRGQFVVIIAK